MNNESQPGAEAIPERNCGVMVELTWKPDTMAAFLRFPSHGVQIKARVPATIRELLCRQDRRKR